MSRCCRPVHAVLSALAIGALLPACGDDAPSGSPDAGADVDPWADEVGPYDRPEEFPRDGCAPGGFGGDVEGIYHLELAFEGGWTVPVAARVDDLGDGWGGVIAGRDATEVRLDGDDVVIRWAGAEGGLRALNLCARGGDGAVHGHYVSCSVDGECFTGVLDGFELEPLDEPAAAGLRLLGEHGPWPASFDAGITVNVRVADGVAYLARYGDGLRILDVSDPAAIAELGHVAVEYPDYGEIWNDVKLVDGPGGRRYALMGSSAAGLVVVDVTDPARAAIVAHAGTEPEPGAPINVHTVFVDGGRAYLANTDLGLEIWDVADPAQPVKLGGFAHPSGGVFGYLHDLYVEGDRAYLNYWDLGMAIVDVSNPAAPAMVGSFVGYGETTSHSSWVTTIGDRRIAVHGDEQYGAHVHIVDVTEGSVDFGNALAEWETRRAVSVHNVMAAGNLAVLAYYQDGIRVLDLSDPASPQPIAHFQTWPGHGPAYGYSFYEGALGIDLDMGQGLIYVADSHRGLLVLALEP